MEKSLLNQIIPFICLFKICFFGIYFDLEQANFMQAFGLPCVNLRKYY